MEFVAAAGTFSEWITKSEAQLSRDTVATHNELRPC
jgi:hypothetical protein